MRPIKIPRRYTGIVMGALLAVIMGFFMSFFITLLNVGVSGDFVSKWMIAFIGTMPIGLPISLLVTPVVKVFVDKITV